MSKNIMGCLYPDDTQISDFGTIRMTKVDKRNKREYLLKSTDIDKLDLIKNASDGSTAYCSDTGDLYLLHMDEWSKVVSVDG